MTKRADLIDAGFYRIQLGKGTIHVGVKLAMAGDDIIATVDGRTHWPDGTLIDPWDIWPRCKGPIPEDEYNYMERRRTWAQEHAPWHPAANAFQPIDLATIPPRF